MSRAEKILLGLALTALIGLGLAHLAIVMTGARGWRPDRSGAGAAAVVGHPHDTDPGLVAGPRQLVRAARSQPGARLLLVLPDTIDRTDLLYARSQLVYLLYPLRVEILRRSTLEEAPPTDVSELLVLAPGVEPLPGCSVAARSHGHRLLSCPRQ